MWDTSGSDRFVGLIPDHLKGAKLIVITYDVCNRTSFANLGRWIRLVREHQNEDNCNTNAMIFLVGNKVDAKQIVVSSQEGRAVAEKNGFFFLETSAAAHYNVSYLLKSIAIAIVKQQRMPVQVKVENINGVYRLTAVA